MYRLPTLVARATLLVCVMATSARAQTVVAYRPNLGTLPQAQGFTLDESVAPSTPPSVVDGVLHQGPTSFDGIQWFHRNDVPFNFDRGFTLESTLKVLSSTYAPNANGPGSQRSGYYPGDAIDELGRRFIIGIDDGGVTVNTDGQLMTTNGIPRIPFVTTDAFHEYRLVVANGVGTLFIDGNAVGSTPIGAVVSAGDANLVQFGDTTNVGSSETQLSFFRYLIPSDSSSEQCQADLTAVQQQLQNLQNQFDSLTLQYGQLQVDFSAATTSIQTLTTQNSQLQTQVNTLTTQNAQAQQTIQALTAQNSQLQTQVNTLTTQNARAQQTIAGLTQTNQTLRTTILGLQQRVNTLTTQNAQLQQSVQALQIALSNANATVNSLVLQLFGEPPDANVAQAAGAVAKARLDDAIRAVGANDSRVQQARQHFNSGRADFLAGNYGLAVREFRQAFTIAQRILNP